MRRLGLRQGMGGFGFAAVRTEGYPLRRRDEGVDMVKRRTKVERVYCIFTIFLVAWFFIGLIGMSTIPEEMQGSFPEEVKFSAEPLLLIFGLIYLLLEAFIIYSKKDLTLERIPDFSTFMWVNVACLLIAGAVSFLSFPAIYLIRNLGRTIPSFAGKVGQAISAIIHFIVGHLWVVGVIAAILGVVLIKYFIYKRFIEGGR